ncbi:LOW QUALITY PROTEIN: hypothetical protein U9M48_019205 [Paspalum notatum var. saurae]|uniref:Reverse transcriptase zinc-binding domain-containing protein n=1 Tax=Paspalum notatum var. saurae TaxID=547442 RepID=A0AAQ3TCP1_PASNO
MVKESDSGRMRRLGEDELSEWREMISQLGDVTLTDSRDKFKLANNGKFVTKSMCMLMLDGGVVDIDGKRIWKEKLLLKIKIFLWMAMRDKIHSAEQLTRRNWKGSDLCKLCRGLETSSHILFACPIAVVLWCWVVSYVKQWEKLRGQRQRSRLMWIECS